MTAIQPRDENGWRIPRPDTLSDAIYNLARQGKKSREIAKILGKRPNIVAVLLWKIRNPEDSNERQNSWSKIANAHDK